MSRTVADFIKVVAGTLYALWLARRSLLWALFLPFMAHMAISAVLLSELEVPARVALSALDSLVFVVLAITTHRLILLGPGSLPSGVPVRFGLRELLFVLYGILISLATIVAVPVAFIPAIGDYLVILPALWIVGRLSLVLPAIAVDRRISLSESWSLTSRHHVLMLLVVGGIPLILSVLLLVIDYMPYTYFLGEALYVAAMVIQVGALTISYKLITDESDGSGLSIRPMPNTG